MPDVVQRDLLILATDLDRDILAKAEKGHYPLERLTDIPAEYRAGVERGEGSFSFSPQIRSMVRFRELNLLADWPIKGQFDVIFCRNVMIYFDDETQSRIWTRFAEHITPDGTLCIGHSERVGSEHGFVLSGQTIYRRGRS
jgi:chemotaxis protein methyltransferase CheR